MSIHDMEPGVRYVCQRCGNCCRWPGEVPVTSDEIDAIASFLKMTPEEFLDRHTAVLQNRTGLTLTERPNGECDFLDGIECTIQAVKPAHCKGFPNAWNFPGWRKECEAIPVPADAPEGTGAPTLQG